MDYLTKKINSKFYWTEEQMHLMINAHIIFLKNEFFELIKWNSNEKKYNMVYEDNYDVLENQIKNDKVIINAIFREFFDKINIKKNPEKQDIKEDIKKGTNYSMKETENLREIKVTVQMNKDQKTEIEQDF